MPGCATTKRKAVRTKIDRRGLPHGWYPGRHRIPSATRPAVNVQSALCGAASNPSPIWIVEKPSIDNRQDGLAYYWEVPKQ